MSSKTQITKEQTQKTDSAEAAFAKALRLISVRERSLSEMRERLQKEGYPEEQVDDTIERLVLYGLLDDTRFAEAYIKGKLRSGWGKIRIERGLKTFGVDVSTIEEYPQAYFSVEDEVERALKELSRLKTIAKNVRDAQYRRLYSKGYSYDTIKRALSRYENDDCY